MNCVPENFLSPQAPDISHDRSCPCQCLTHFVRQQEISCMLCLGVVTKGKNVVVQDKKARYVKDQKKLP